MKKNKLLTTAVALSVLATAGIATVPVQAATGDAKVNVCFEAGLIDVKVPTKFTFSMDAEGTSTCTSGIGTEIANASLAPIKVASVTIQNNDGWTQGNFAEFDNEKITVNSKEYAIEVNGMDVSDSDFETQFIKDVGVVSSVANTAKDGSDKYAFESIDSKFALQSEDVTNAKVTSMIITVDWATQADLSSN